MVVQTSRRSLMAGMAATATAAALLPGAAIARDAGGASEGLAYRTAGDLVKAIAGRQVSSRELADPTYALCTAGTAVTLRLAPASVGGYSGQTLAGVSRE